VFSTVDQGTLDTRMGKRAPSLSLVRRVCLSCAASWKASY